VPEGLLQLEASSIKTILNKRKLQKNHAKSTNQSITNPPSKLKQSKTKLLPLNDDTDERD
jgi:hypothetical protein